MKRQITSAILRFILMFIILNAISMMWLLRHNRNKGYENEMVLLNEITQLTTDENGYNPAARELRILREQLQANSTLLTNSVLLTNSMIFTNSMISADSMYVQMCIVSMTLTAVWILIVFLYLYFKILRPFGKLESYAGEIAKGNLEVRLDYERTNFFGAFTWAFDHMREEIIRAKKCEAQAVQENKTVIAALSHDIKTPIASIRAYAEGLEAGLDTTYEKRQRYAHVIMKKCDEVTGLTNDLVLHSLSELERIEIREQNLNIREVLEAVIMDLEYPDLKLQEPVPEAVITADEKRLAQVLENLLNNAGKYAAGSRVIVSARIKDDRYEISVRDYGPGIAPEDMPFILDKFYRGRNAGNQPGSGLGLYITNYLMKRMQGGLTLTSHKDGLEAVVWFPLLKTS